MRTAHWFIDILSNFVLRVSEQRPPANNDAGDGSEESEIVRLVQNLKHVLHPYTQLHHTCDATEPLQKIDNSLSPQEHTLIAVMSLIHDALEVLIPLRDRQIVSIRKLSGAKPILQRAGLASCLSDARIKAQQTAIDVLNLEEWLMEYNKMPIIGALTNVGALNYFREAASFDPQKLSGILRPNPTTTEARSCLLKAQSRSG